MKEVVGSNASPYVRRIRMYLQEHEIAYKFTKINVMEKEGQEYLKKFGPIKRVPVLIDQDRVISDSNIILKYLEGKDTTIEEDELNLLINEACSSALSILQAKRFGLDDFFKSPLNYVHTQRVKNILSELDKYITNNKTNEFTNVKMWLYCLLDWFSFRDLFETSDYKGLGAFMKQYSGRESVINTDPRIDS